MPEEKKSIKNRYKDLISTVKATDREVVSEGEKQPVNLSSEWVLGQINNTKEEVKKEAREDAKKEIEKQVQTDKASLITVFGIFASIVSFLTIEFQFLKTLCSIEKITGFSVLLFSMLFGFNVALDYLVKSRTDKEVRKPNIFFILLVVALFIIGSIFILHGNEEVCHDNQIYQKYQNDFDSRVDSFNDQNNLKFKDLQFQMQELNNKIGSKK